MARRRPRTMWNGEGPGRATPLPQSSPPSGDNSSPNGLTRIHECIHCVATPDTTEGGELHEMNRLVIDHFLLTLADIALGVAQREEERQPCGP